MKNLLKKWLNKPYVLYLYDDFLKNDNEVVLQVPKQIAKVKNDFFVLLFIVQLKDGREYAKAVIKIERKNVRCMFKYDTGIVKNKKDYKVMLHECITHIVNGWGLDTFYKSADQRIKQISLLDKFLYL